jgi:hypothetical protein
MKGLALRPSAPEKAYYSNGEDAVVMQKMLD